ncbi:putative fad synthetase protein [Eutypa lata UCREL1]|uniref:FAD synthase n=1 Tax=Eutypa lata (strain UCR-EL1) TaxID=1287681 RepID=M7SBE6_EUTLA|nr:putative fad synthetase protein [Eutypa lata UCREL1]
MSEISPTAAATAVKDIAHPVISAHSEKTVNGNGNGATTAAAADAGGMEALCRDLRRKVDGFLERQIDDHDEVLRSTQKQVRVATGVIDEALRRYRPEELSLSYNGGKDCLVLLILILASLPSHFPSSTSSSDSSSIPPSDTTNTATIPATATTTSATATTTPSFPTTFQALYIRPLSPFPEVDDFVAETTARYHLDLATSDKPMKAALTDYLSSAPIPTQEQQRGDHAHGRGQDVRAVFVGTRRTDPHGQFLTHFDETDRDWPRFMRVHPVIDWHYREVWGFIRALEIPYCPLYDKGYTSLGGTDDTHPNPALLLNGGAEVNIGNGGGDGDCELKGKRDQRFRPAYELMEDGEERLGRDR